MGGTEFSKPCLQLGVRGILRPPGDEPLDTRVLDARVDHLQHGWSCLSGTNRALEIHVPLRGGPELRLGRRQFISDSRDRRLGSASGPHGDYETGGWWTAEQREAGAFFGFAQDLRDVLECKTTVLTRDACRPRQYTH